MKKYLVVLEDEENETSDELFFETDSEFDAYEALNRAINLGAEDAAWVVTNYSKQYYDSLVRNPYWWGA